MTAGTDETIKNVAVGKANRLAAALFDSGVGEVAHVGGQADGVINVRLTYGDADRLIAALERVAR